MKKAQQARDAALHAKYSQMQAVQQLLQQHSQAQIKQQLALARSPLVNFSTAGPRTKQRSSALKSSSRPVSGSLAKPKNQDVREPFCYSSPDKTRGHSSILASQRAARTAVSGSRKEPYHNVRMVKSQVKFETAERYRQPSKKQGQSMRVDHRRVGSTSAKEVSQSRSRDLSTNRQMCNRLER